MYNEPSDTLVGQFPHPSSLILKTKKQQDRAAVVFRAGAEGTADITAWYSSNQVPETKAVQRRHMEYIPQQTESQGPLTLDSHHLSHSAVCMLYSFGVSHVMENEMRIHAHILHT